MGLGKEKCLWVRMEAMVYRIKELTCSTPAAWRPRLCPLGFPEVGRVGRFRRLMSAASLGMCFSCWASFQELVEVAGQGRRSCGWDTTTAGVTTAPLRRSACCVSAGASKLSCRRSDLGLGMNLASQEGAISELILMELFIGKQNKRRQKPSALCSIAPS